MNHGAVHKTRRADVPEVRGILRGVQELGNPGGGVYAAEVLPEMQSGI